MKRKTSLLREIRKSRGWTQQRLADASGVSRETIAKLETGVLLGNSYGVRTRLASTLGVDPASLFTDRPSDLAPSESPAVGIAEPAHAIEATMRTLRQRRLEHVAAIERIDAALAKWERCASVVGDVAGTMTEGE
jgi:transcriptional regulator with XRE-family HTH domain